MESVGKIWEYTMLGIITGVEWKLNGMIVE